MDNEKLIQSWKQTQENGELVYDLFPQYNLSIKGRRETETFKAFCNYKGTCLDIGSGPIVPNYLEDNKDSIIYGIDPLLKHQSKDDSIILLKAVGESLPFQDNYFDIISFATSFDHVINPEKTLSETKRVLRNNGHAIFWISKQFIIKQSLFQKGLNKVKHSIKTNPEITKQTELIERLSSIDECIDKLHLRHFSYQEFINLASNAGLELIQEEEHQDFQSTFLRFRK